MAAFDATESLTPFRDVRGAGGGAILFDATCLRQAGGRAADPVWFDPAWWGDRAEPVGSGGRGGAWFVDGAPSGGGFGPAVLRHYLRGGVAARFSHNRFIWRGVGRIRSFDEFRLLRELLRRKLPVPRPIAAIYWRDGMSYRAGILLERLQGVTSLADRATAAGSAAPWKEAGQMIARIHRAGLDHADLNAHNVLFEDSGRGWVIDLDRSQLRIPATPWREANLARLQRSLLKLRGARSEVEVEKDYAALRNAYDALWQRGT
ncbi:MAG: 3-deoxy-D-manno-octulosonic acid kinase [Lysobacter sp.]|nr:3-deoxy-D-manno-octulosonic acid kinase [Lysobacter sp.]